MAGGVVLIATVVEIAAWRVGAALAGLVGLSGMLGALMALGLAIRGAGDATPPLAISAALVGIAAGLLLIGHLFNSLLGRDEDDR